MHIYHSPRGKDGFFIGIFELRHNFDNSLCTECRRQFVCGFGEFADSQSRADNNVFVVILQNIEKQFLSKSLWHKFFPGFRIDNGDKIFKVNYLRYVGIRAVKQQRQTDRYCTKEIEQFLLFFFLLFVQFQSLLFFFGQVFFRFAFGFFGKFALLVRHAGFVYIDFGLFLTFLFRGYNV